MRRSLPLLLVCLLFSPLSAHAKFLLRDVGLIGLMSHDVFAWDHKREVNTENGRLDLSTIFDYDGGSRWSQGGNPKNAENAPVYSITMTLVDHYRGRLFRGDDPKEARRSTVLLFHDMLKECYERLLAEPLPAQALRDFPNNTEQGALRGLHDVLPGQVKLYGRVLRRKLVLTNFLTAKTRLNKRELDQPIKDFDGDYDIEYKQIQIPLTGVTLNLMEIDRKFIEKFTPYKQAEMLADLARVGRGEIPLHQVYFIHHVKELFAKGLCSEENEYMPARSCI
ncbi:MAG: hypothetical protein KF802_10245 [Bdellovibrionaceae bacterium]|nr:hypothetical protein [Pseudobdellovibrionaceae bacterium]MBX3033791.1 hypothetical protein [Pseudobdellovibrionaceae bacterium]